MFSQPTTLDDLTQLVKLIKSWAWSAPPVVDVYICNNEVRLRVDVDGAKHKRTWRIM